MFQKILIANRGEIAVRIMATCREMGIATVAVYSAADRSARHVREADEAWEIGPAPASQSYLQIARIIEAAHQSGAEAIHPGYGFLSENPDLVEACEAAGLTFIGPPASAMRLMGSKIAAKQLARSVAAPTLPGYHGESQDDEQLLAAARQTGFPVLIKAAAGGGGKGMRVVQEEACFLEELAGARREAQASFGDSTVFLEKLLLRPRHVEIQILGDRYGHLIHLGERECSIQRRHQKIIEESPSIALTPTLRNAMGATAVRIASAAGYVNAGTMEFLLDTDQQFYFLEMNTRLQVEHPVTELVTGLDLVRQQLLIAAGEPLTLKQEEITPRGHAIEVRLYAEDPAQDFLPSTGVITHVYAPTTPGVRLDSGVERGDEITQFYDPMIAKMIVYGEDRAAAIARLQQALAHTAILGVTTNIPLLQAIAAHPAYSEGQTYTSFLQEYGLLEPAAQAIPPARLIPALQAAALVELVGPEAGVQTASRHPQMRNPWLTLGAWRSASQGLRTRYTYEKQSYQITLIPAGEGEWSVQIDENEPVRLTCIFAEQHQVVLRRGQKLQRVTVIRQPEAMFVSIEGRVLRLERRQALSVDLVAHSGTGIEMQKALTAPMAGTIVKVQVQDGSEVAARQVLVILSAMKMEHTVIAPHAGRVRRVHYKEGDVVKGGAVLVEMEETGN